jgi:hypothetical protein
VQPPDRTPDGSTQHAGRLGGEGVR